MSDIKTDEETIEVIVVHHEDVDITEVVCPSVVAEGEVFSLTYVLANNGSMENCYADVKVNGLIVDRHDPVILPGSTEPMTTMITSPVTGNMTIVIEAGYTD
ncbi:MAG: hypothetical protein KAS32_13950 [Candidatus Peribacteraceae bacterium]|nr:hypothetical protein [Candidatus Peribacteraceae bacterium]